MKQNNPQPRLQASPASPLDAPPIASHEDAKTVDRFFERLAVASCSVLMLDYDGTLAPFTADRLQARPYPGVRERLERLLSLHRTRIAMVSGRKAAELQTLLALPSPIEIWGSHGREHLARDGTYSNHPLTGYEKNALDALRAKLEKEFAAKMLEYKPNSIAVHWRGAEEKADEVKRSVAALYRQLEAGQGSEGKLQLLPFDGGMEVRAGSVNKGHAVQNILTELPAGAPAAFLGDDNTDEDAFKVLDGDGHLPVLVASKPRKSFARARLSGPQEVLAFLDRWIVAVEKPLSEQVH